MKRKPSPPVTIVKCHFCSTESPRSENGPNVLAWADRNGWTWFTGKLPNTIRGCATCASELEAQYNAKLTDSAATGATKAEL